MKATPCPLMACAEGKQNQAMDFCTSTSHLSRKCKMLLTGHLSTKWWAGGEAGRASTDREARLGTG